jgi:hypothetical protein
VLYSTLHLGKESLASYCGLYSRGILPPAWMVVFIFHSPEDADKILVGLWPFDGGNIMLKRWRLAFDPVQDYFQFRHLWVLLPGLPLNFWSYKTLMAIGNSIGGSLVWMNKRLVLQIEKWAGS